MAERQDTFDSNAVTRPEVYVIVDSVQDPAAPIMKLDCKKVEGMDEPIKNIATAGFAVGADTNTVYSWEIL